MVAVRNGIFDGSLLTLFPKALENTSVSPALLVSGNEARQIVDIIPNNKKAGSGSKRFGLGKKGPATSANFVDGWEFRAADGSITSIHYFDDGTLQRFNGSTYTTIKSGLNTSGVMGAVQFNGKIIFSNGLDQSFSFDGTTVADLGEYVTDYGTSSGGAQNAGMATSPIWNSTSSIKITPGAGRTDYPNGRSIRVTFATAGVVTATVSSTSSASGVLTINVTGTPFPVSTQTILRVEYFDKPPPFSVLYPFADILFGLSGGSISASLYRGANSMKVYYQTASNNENSWFSQGTTTSTQNVAYINTQNKVPVFDELVGISSIDQNLVLHGRQYLQIYSGLDPNTIGSFVWAKNIPVGTLSGKLIQKIPSDVVFACPFGIVSLRRVFQTEAAEVVSDIGSAVDNTVATKVITLNSDDTSYRKGRSFYYQRDGLIGFKLDDNNLLVYVLNQRTKGWVEFAGYFQTASSFTPMSDGRLLVGRANQLYAYANGTDGNVGISYADDTSPISPTWWIPWLSKRGKRYANKAYKVLLEDSVACTINIDRMINYNEMNIATCQANVAASGSQWDVSQWDASQWDGSLTNPVVSDKFLAEENFSLRVRESSVNGPINILGIRPIGR